MYPRIATPLLGMAGCALSLWCRCNRGPAAQPTAATTTTSAAPSTLTRLQRPGIDHREGAGDGAQKDDAVMAQAGLGHHHGLHAVGRDRRPLREPIAAGCGSELEGPILRTQLAFERVIGAVPVEVAVQRLAALLVNRCVPVGQRGVD